MNKFLFGAAVLSLSFGALATEVNHNIYSYNYSDPRIQEFTQILSATGLFGSPQASIHSDNGNPSIRLHFDKCLIRLPNGDLKRKAGVEWEHSIEISLPGRDSDSNVWVHHLADKDDYIVYGDSLVERTLLRAIHPLKIAGINAQYKLGRKNAAIIVKAKEGFEKMVAQRENEYLQAGEKKVSRAGIINFIKRNIQDPCR